MKIPNDEKVFDKTVFDLRKFNKMSLDETTIRLNGRTPCHDF
jgi:hypothetical protein